MKEPPPPAAPRSPADLFWSFTWLALQGFGGVLAVAQRVLCEQKRWLTKAQYLELLSLGQVLPGPNVFNLSLMVGDRWFGLRGAFAALAGMMLLPLVLVLLLTALYTQFADQPLVAGALRGMGAVSAGLIIGSALQAGALAQGRAARPAAVCAARRRHLRRDRAAALAARLGAAGTGTRGLRAGVAAARRSERAALDRRWTRGCRCSAISCCCRCWRSAARSRSRPTCTAGWSASSS